jgi:hypothetical protein
LNDLLTFTTDTAEELAGAPLCVSAAGLAIVEDKALER